MTDLRAIDTPALGGAVKAKPVVRLGAAVVGTGFIGGVHARSARLAGAELIGVAASTPQRPAQAAERLGAQRAFADAAEAIAADDVDVIHICTPNHLHAPVARAALAAGKHVVCEKPLATDVAEAEAMAALVVADGRVGTVPFVYRYHPVVHEARARVASGQTGSVRLLHGGYLQDWLSDAGDVNWRVDPALGGASRAFADIGSHWFDLAEFISGDRVAAVCAQSATFMAARGDTPVTTEDAMSVLFRTVGGAMGTMLVSQVSPGRKNHLHVEIACERESVRFEQERPETLWIGDRRGTHELWRDPGTLGPEAARLATIPAGHPEGYNDAFASFVSDTYEAISGGDPAGLPRFEDGVRSARVVDAVLRSAAAGDWTEVPA